MKKVLKLLVAFILAIVILGGAMFLVDCSRVKSGKTPICVITKEVYKDGGTVEYTGLGYKIIDFNRVNGYDEVKIGSWFMKYEDFEEEYKKLDKPIEKDDGEKKDEQGEINIESGDVSITSGEIEPVSGDVSLSGDQETSGDISSVIASGDAVSGDNVPEEKGFSFRATIIGMSGNTLVVSPLEDEEERLSSDMISFSVQNIESAKNQVYLIGQKVKIEYDGNIAETYPAQINASNIEVVE